MNWTTESQMDTGETDADNNTSMYIVTAKLASMDKNIDVNFEVRPVKWGSSLKRWTEYAWQLG